MLWPLEARALRRRRGFQHQRGRATQAQMRNMSHANTRANTGANTGANEVI